MRKLGYGFLELYLPLYRFFGYQKVIKNGLLEAIHFKHYVSFPAYKGFRPEYGEWDGTGLAQMETEPVILDNKVTLLFEKYLDQCKADSIQVVLVYSPLYIAAQQKMSGLDEAKAYFSEQAALRGFTYLDYTDSPISKDTSNFCIAVHMNPVATDAFTQILFHDLDSLKTDF